jgi:iron complex transport system permease protein
MMQAFLSGKLFQKMLPAFLLLLALGLGLFSLQIGSIHLSQSQLLAVVLSKGSEVSQIVLTDIRIPRVLTAISSGAALAVSGFILQKVTRNDLACPTVLGVNQGASLVVLILLLCLPAINLSLYFFLVLLGGLVAFLLVYVFSGLTRASVAKLVLIGVTFNALFYGLTYLLLVVFPDRAQDLLFVLNGTLAGVHQLRALYLLVITVLVIFIVWLFRRRLELLAADTTLLSALGCSVKKSSVFFILLAVVLAASATAVTGPVFFFGLVIPHIAKRLFLSRKTSSVLVCALLGSIAMLLTDTFIRAYFNGAEVSLSIVFAFASAPCLILLLRAAKL